MADIESPDRVGVKVWPDTRNFLKDLRSTLKRVEKQVKASIPVVADSDRLVRDVKESAKAAEKAAGKIEVPAALEDGFVAKMRRDLKAATASLEAGIPLTADGERMRREARLQVEALQAQLRAMAVEVPVDVESAAAQRAELAASIAALQAQARLNPIEVPVKVSGMSLLRQELQGAFGGRRGGVFSSMIGGLARLGAAVPVKIFESFGDALKVFKSTFETATAAVSEGGEGMSKLAGFAFSAGRGVGALVGSLAGIAGAVAVGVGAIVLLTGAIGGTVSAISLLTGMLTAFVGVIGTAIVGPLMAAVPALVAFGGGALVAAGGIAMWAKQSKEVKNFLPPIKHELKDLADQIGPTMDKMTRLFGKATVSLIRDFGDSVESVLDDMYAKMSDPAMDKFYDQWSVKMPSIFEELGKAIGSFGAGLTAFFTPILPYAEALAMHIRGAADSFSEWAQSAAGQNAIADWMSEAWEISKDLWSGLKDIGGAILDIMGIGVDESGGSFAQWVRDIGEDFKKWTESKQGREDIRQWFEDAEELARDVRDIIVLIGDAFDTLDSPAGRGMLDAFMEFVKFVAFMGSVAATQINLINTGVQGLVEWLNRINLENLGRLIEWFTETDWSQLGTDVLSGILEGLGLEAFTSQIQAAMSAIGDAIVEFFKARLGIASPSTVMAAVALDVGRGILQGLLQIPMMLVTAVTAIGTGIVTTIVGALSTLPILAMQALSGFGTQLATWATTAWSGVTAAFGPAVAGTVAFFVGIPGRLLGALVGLAGRLAGWASRAWGRVTGSFIPAVAGTVMFFISIPGRLVGALAGLAGRLAGWASRAWGRARTAFGGAVGATVAFFVSIPGRLMGAIAGLAGRLAGWASTAWGRARTAFGGGVGSTVAFFVGIPGRLIGAISGLGGRLAGWASSAWSRARSAFTTGVSGTLTFMSGIPGRIIGLISGLGGRLSSWASGAWSWAQSGFVNGVSSTLTLMSGVPGQIVSALGDLGSLLYSAGTSVVQGLIDGIRSKIPDVGGAMGDLATAIRNHMPGSPVKEGPLRAWNYGNGTSLAGRKLISGLAEGMNAERSSIADSSRLIASAAMPAFASVGADTMTPAGGSSSAAQFERALSSWQPRWSIGDRDLVGVMERAQTRQRGR